MLTGRAIAASADFDEWLYVEQESVRRLFRQATIAFARWALWSAATGVIFFAAFAGIASDSDQSAIVLAFYGAVALAWTWLSALSARLRTDAAFL